LRRRWSARSCGVKILIVMNERSSALAGVAPPLGLSSMTNHHAKQHPRGVFPTKTLQS
jgi:hypothetical protein